MCRSIMIKGLEALTTECMLSARHYGVEDEVLRSLADTLPHDDWPGLARYVMSRALLHGRRRAEEMREVARTVEQAGVEPLLSEAIAERQDWAAAQGRRLSPEELAAPDLSSLLDALCGPERMVLKRRRPKIDPPSVIRSDAKPTAGPQTAPLRAARHSSHCFFHCGRSTTVRNGS